MSPARLERRWPDLLPLLCLGAILAFGLLALWSARPEMLRKQLVYLVAGLVVFLAALRFDYRLCLRHAELFYLGGLLALAGVLLTRPVNGAHSWYDLKVFKLQPSEFMKLVFVIVLAAALARREERVSPARALWALLLAFVPIALIIKQPDLGTACIYVAVAAVMLFLAGTPLRLLSALAGLSVVGAAGFWFAVLNQVQRMRLVAWWDPLAYRAAQAYQYMQSLIAIGSGGLTGKGLGQGTQHGLSRVPEEHNDFIFTVTAEDLGFAGAAALVLLYLLLGYTLFTVAARARDPAGRLLAAGLATLLTFQALLNIAVVLGLLPTTGIPLPFASYGGSSLVTSLAAVGLVLNVGSRKEARGFDG